MGLLNTPRRQQNRTVVNNTAENHERHSQVPTHLNLEGHSLECILPLENTQNPRAMKTKEYSDSAKLSQGSHNPNPNSNVTRAGSASKPIHLLVTHRNPTKISPKFADNLFSSYPKLTNKQTNR